MSDRENMMFGIKIRFVEEQDREDCRKIALQIHAVSPFRNQRFSEQKYADNFSLVLSRPQGVIGIVAEWNDTVIGFSWMKADNFLYTEGPPFVAVQIIAVNLDDISSSRRAKCFLALVAGIKGWVAQTGSTHAFINVTTGYKLESTHRLLLFSKVLVL